jgi:hypothetical protein
MLVTIVCRFNTTITILCYVNQHDTEYKYYGIPAASAADDVQRLPPDAISIMCLITHRGMPPFP